MSLKGTFTTFMEICYFPTAVRNTALYKYHNQDVQFPSQDSNCLPLKYEAWQPINISQHETKEDKETAAKEWELCNYNLPLSCYLVPRSVPLTLPSFLSVLFWGTPHLLSASQFLPEAFGNIYENIQDCILEIHQGVFH